MGFLGFGFFWGFIGFYWFWQPSQPRAGWLTDEAVWETLGGLSGSPAQASREAVECDLGVLTFDGKCPSGYEYSWYRFNTEVNFNADDGVGTLPLGFVEAPHNPRITMQTIAFFPRLELCCRIC